MWILTTKGVHSKQLASQNDLFGCFHKPKNSLNKSCYLSPTLWKIKIYLFKFTCLAAGYYVSYISHSSSILVGPWSRDPPETAGTPCYRRYQVPSFTKPDRSHSTQNPTVHCDLLPSNTICLSFLMLLGSINDLKALRLLSDRRLSDRHFFEWTFPDQHRDIGFPDQRIER